MSLRKKLHQSSSDTEMAKEIQVNQIKNRYSVSMGEISSCNSTMDFDRDGTKS